MLTFEEKSVDCINLAVNCCCKQNIIVYLSIITRVKWRESPPLTYGLCINSYLYAMKQNCYAVKWPLRVTVNVEMLTILAYNNSIQIWIDIKSYTFSKYPVFRRIQFCTAWKILRLVSKKWIFFSCQGKYFLYTFLIIRESFLQ